MSRVLCTFPGKAGDILWSLATARQISTMTGVPVDFGMMPYYRALLPLIEQQPYVHRAFVIEDWVRTGSAHGDEPAVPQNDLFHREYERVYHLGYRSHPGITSEARPLIDFIAWQQGIRLREPVPFIDTMATSAFALPPQRYVALAFNEQYDERKAAFVVCLRTELPPTIAMFDMSQVPWEKAPYVAANAVAYVGDRSGNWVIAKGVDAKCITFEPHPSRNAFGHLGTVFGCPYGKSEMSFQHGIATCLAAKLAAKHIIEMAA